jgi:5'-nucleotidase/UDP-sugar diphosphatase
MRRCAGGVGILLTVCAVVLGAGTSRPASRPAGGPVELVFLHVNDTHGQTQGAPTIGGEARLATLVAEYRAKPGPARVFLTHCGDILSRGDALTRHSLGAANFALMDRLRYDAWVPGNGDFYDGLDVLQARMKEARFPTLAANVTVKSTGKPLTQGHVIEWAGDVRVAFFGLCTIEVGQRPASGVSVQDPVEAAKRLMPDLRRQADLVVALTHIGYAEDLRLAEAVPGIDLILGGHSHTFLAEGREVKHADGRVTLVCQAGWLLMHLGVATVRLAPAPGAGYTVRSLSAKTVPLDRNVKPDPEVQDLLKTLSRPASRPAA